MDGEQKFVRLFKDRWDVTSPTLSSYQRANSELTQQDGRGNKTANLVWQPWQQFCLKNVFAKHHFPLNRSFCKNKKTLTPS